MPRPMKRRNVCSLPGHNRFGPLDVAVDDIDFVEMFVDEYEAIRLIDLEGFTQEECSIQMNVARTTVQSIYSSAREKLAQSLVNNKALIIKGGEYRLCGGNGGGCGRGCLHNGKVRNQGLNKGQGSGKWVGRKQQLDTKDKQQK